MARKFTPPGSLTEDNEILQIWEFREFGSKIMKISCLEHFEMSRTQAAGPPMVQKANVFL